ncbi:hypothetical protein BS47DRAFT_1365438 [Hydnum rufescens UP504]|uniref:Uncharacterized protein n=1 Tax=Hydnum rufescens UP504 TaxID=1448309 RepID=A0A9P6APD4_9AGAM|nr:hypothetical protein BS47DRAFT_1365438 [Hydnum rufescens UP504]
MPSVPFRVQKGKNKSAPAACSSSVTNVQGRKKKLGSVAHLPSTTRMDGGIRDGSAGATQLKLGDHTEEREKGQCKKNAFNGWLQMYMKEHPNPPQGEDGHYVHLPGWQCNYMKEVIAPAWCTFKQEHEVISDLDEQLSILWANMAKTDSEDMKLVAKGAGLSHLMAAKQDGMAQCTAEVRVHTIILMVTGQAHDDKSAAQNGVFYGSDASQWFWATINNPIGHMLWQFYIFVDNDTIQLEQAELNPGGVQVTAWHAELVDILKAKADRFAWQGFADLLYGHQLKILNWGVAPGFVNLDCNASNSVVSWHLLCSEFHMAPQNIIIISVHQWNTVDSKKSLKDQGSVLIMSDLVPGGP